MTFQVAEFHEAKMKDEYCHRGDGTQRLQRFEALARKVDSLAH